MAGFGGSRPRMLMCYLCGREYGTKSLPIHIPQCQKKWLQQEEQKPKKDRRPLPQPPKDLDNLKEAGVSGLSAERIDQMNAEAYSNWEDKTLERCAFCDRTFRPEAMAHHRKACSADKPFRKAGTGLTDASLSSRISVDPKLQDPRVAGKVGVNGFTGSYSTSRPGTPELRQSMPSLSSKLSPGTTGGSKGSGSSHLGKTAKPRAKASPPPPATAGLALTVPSLPSGAPSTGASKFCDECGAAFLRETSKFCGECGAKRAGV